MKSAAEINAKKIEAILAAAFRDPSNTTSEMPFRVSAQRVVEAFPELQSLQFTSERDGTSRTVVTPLPWADEAR